MDKHLVQKTSADDDDPRFTILEAIREFAWDEIRVQGELEGIKHRYMTLYLELARKAEVYLRGAEQTAWLDAVEREYPNFMLAMEIGAAAPVDSRLWQGGLWILAHLEQYWMIRALFNDLIPLSNCALGLIEQSALPNERARILKATLLGVAGTCAWLSTNFQQAVEFHEASLAICRELGDESRAAFALNNKAVNLGELGKHEASLQCYTESLALYEKLGDHWGQTRLHWNLCNYYTFISRDFSKVAYHNERGLYHAQQSGDIFMLAASNLGMGEFRMLRGEYQQAQAYYEEAARLGRLYHYHKPLTAALTGLASLALLRGDAASAAGLIREGFPLALEQMDHMMMSGYVRLGVWLASIQKQPIRVAFLGGMHEAVWRDLRALYTLPDMWGGMEAALQSARAELGEAAFMQEYIRGQSLPLDESVAFALESCLSPSLPHHPDMTFSSLTERETETLRLLAKGKTNQEISGELFITIKTVEKHVANILRKLGMKNRTEAAAWAVKQGLVQTEAA